MGGYKTRVVSKIDDDGIRGYRVEIWRHHTGWIDALQPWYYSKPEAEAKARAMSTGVEQGVLL